MKRDLETLRANVRTRTEEGECENTIHTTKYTLLSWLPVSLMEQFKRLANVYFLICSILMFIGTYAPQYFASPLNPFTTAFTLMFVMLVTSFKEGFEDLQRYRSDFEDNNRPVTVVTFDETTEEPIETIKKSQDIRVGDIVKLTGRVMIPADMLIILTSNYFDANQCYVETTNIDGETNLKVREAPVALNQLIDGDKKPPMRKSLFTGFIEYELPNKNIHTFIGAFHSEALGDPIPLDQNNVLLRSSVFSSTDWGYGIALYCGQNTKVQLSTVKRTTKLSQIERAANFAVLVTFIAQISLVSIAVIFIYALGYDDLSLYSYIYINPNSTGAQLPLWLERWLIIFLLMNSFIPISLYVTMEMINIGQSFLVHHDIELYDETIDSPCIVKSSNMCQEPGCISHIFSDKTGTLTRNEMVFVKYIVNNRFYNISSQSPVLNGISDDNEILDLFYTCLATCHTVVREKNGSYRAESPDELALIRGLAFVGVTIEEQLSSTLVLNYRESRRKFDILAINSFNADRKRMSVLLKDNSSGDYIIFCKGADNIMMEICTIDSTKRSSYEEVLSIIAQEGLRTLCVAFKRVEKEVALQWQNIWKKAASSLQNRSENLAEAAAMMEVELQLLGVTAIEDRLQDEVPEVLADLAAAGITLWMLTGDKEETAVNIGYSCNLLRKHFKLFYATGVKDNKELKEKLKAISDEICPNFSINVSTNTEKNNALQTALVLDGPSFKNFDENDTEMRKELIQIASNCRSVIACRLTPAQKQMLVSMMKNDAVPKAITLAIGDGANDVSMILEADVGVGIIGKEGRQAANSADFAVGQFKALRRLILVHGRWNYVRQSKAFLYCMHKNMVIAIILFWFSFLDLLSGTSPFESWLYGGFNFALAWPIIFLGVFDRDISAAFALDHPQTYITGRSGSMLSTTAMTISILNAILYSIFISLIVFNCMGSTFSVYGLFELGTLLFFSIINTLQLKVSFMLHQVNILNALAMIISVGGLFGVASTLGAIPDYFTNGYFSVTDWVYEQGCFWLFGHLFIPVLCVLLDFLQYAFQIFFFPSNENIMREADVLSQKSVLAKDNKIYPSELSELYQKPLPEALN